MGGAMDMDGGGGSGRSGVCTQSGAWLASAGSPQRRVLFRPALAKGSSLNHHSPSLPQPLNATMAGCSNNIRAGSSSNSSSSSHHEPLNWSPASRIGAGLSNLGNTCFLNSVLQCLTYTPPLAGYLESGQHKSTCRAAGFCAMCALQEHVRQALASSSGVVSPSNLVKSLRCISKSFRMWRQEDAHEYMRYLIEALHNCCLPPGAAANSTVSQERSLIHKIFGGRLRSQVKCTICSTCSNTYDPLLDLSLEIVRADSLTKALNRFTAVEALEGDNKYHCGHCRRKVRALKQFTIDKSPNILTIQFKRFSGSGSSGGKIDKKIEFGRTLDMKPYISNPQDSDAKYSLYAVLVHAGWSTHSGHYYCFVRTAGDMWHALDDSRVKQVSEKTVLDQKAYILFYIRDSASRSSSAMEQSLPNSLPACKRLLSDGAGETADDTSADEPDSSGCQVSRGGGACGPVTYSNGHCHDADEREVTTAAPNSCPLVRPAGNSQVSLKGDKVAKSNGTFQSNGTDKVGKVNGAGKPNGVDKAGKVNGADKVSKVNGAGDEAGHTVGPIETIKEPNGNMVLASVEKSIVNGIKIGGENTQVVVNGAKVGLLHDKTLKTSSIGATESSKAVVKMIKPDILPSYVESQKIPTATFVEVGRTELNLRNGSGLVEDDKTMENGRDKCSTSGEEQRDDSDDHQKRFSSSTPHSYMRLLYAMPHTRRYWLAKSLPIQRDRKRVAGKKIQGLFENGHEIGMCNGSSSCGKELKRPCCTLEASGLSKKQKLVRQENLPTIVGAGAMKGAKADGPMNGIGSEATKVFRERMELDEACPAGDLGPSANDVAREGECGKRGPEGETGAVNARTFKASQQANGSNLLDKSLSKQVENGWKSEINLKENCRREFSQVLKQDFKIMGKGSNSFHSQSNGMYGFEVPRWSEVESNRNGSVKDIDALLHRDKTVVPKQDLWDEEYDRGKLKKVRNGITSDNHSSVTEVAGIANPFQAISSSKQRPIDDNHGRGIRQTGIRSHNSDN